MKMKRFFAILLTLLLTINTVGLTVFAEETQAKTADVYVTIADGEGELALAQEKITVTDIDNDGSLSINDALYCAHEERYEGGASAGYETAQSQWGLSLVKLWGVANGGSYGYYVNNTSAWSLTDVVKEGDYLNAFVYTDLTAWTDTYCFFDTNTVSADQNDEVTFTLKMSGYDGNKPIEGATITVNDVATNDKTDAEGKVTIKLSEAGTCVISAISATQVLVPPVCVANVIAPATVYVTISDEKGDLTLTQEPVVVTDVDDDGSLSINDALYCAHEEKYEGGASAGYETAQSQWGLSLVKLWGVANGGSYGYYVNNTSAWSLTDIVKEGDYLNAFVYTDLTTWSDTYCYFNVNTVNAKQGDKITLTLSANGYDENSDPIVVAVENAIITINGEKTTVKTDKDGKCILTFDKDGTYLISATSDNHTLVPPVCEVTVSTEVPQPEASPKTGDEASVVLFSILFIAAFAGVVVFLNREKKYYEK